mgnify:CR=1
MLRDFIVDFLPFFILLCFCYAPIAIFRDLKKMLEDNSIKEKSE